MVQEKLINGRFEIVQGQEEANEAQGRGRREEQQQYTKVLNSERGIDIYLQREYALGESS